MLSDEEKKAIHDLKILRQGIGLLNCIPNIEKDEVDIEAIDTVLNLIEKQSKEIEELKDFNTKLQATKDRLDSYDKENTLEIEKLEEEIEELKKDKLELINKHVVHLKDFEKELREMRKVIDTKNAEIECLNVIHESYKEMVEENNFISKDKIKAKIGKRMQKNNNTIHNAKLKHGKDYVYYDDVQEAKEENRICKEILQSLLEKE